MKRFRSYFGAVIVGVVMLLSFGPTLAEDVTEIGFTLLVYSANEGHDIQFIVKKTGSGEALVNYTFGHSDVDPAKNATRGKDFIGQDGELYFAPDDTEHAITVQTRSDDEFDEDSESFKISLSIPNDADGAAPVKLGSKRHAVGVILNCVTAC